MNDLIPKTVVADSVFRLPSAPVNSPVQIFVAKHRSDKPVHQPFLYENPRDELFPSGSASLDAILNGGFRPGSLNGIVGLPGCGKTTLAELIAVRYNCVRRTEFSGGITPDPITYNDVLGFDYYLLSRTGIVQSDVAMLDKLGSKMGNLRPYLYESEMKEYRDNRSIFIERLREVTRKNGAFCIYTVWLRTPITELTAALTPKALPWFSDSIIQLNIDYKGFIQTRSLSPELGLGIFLASDFDKEPNCKQSHSAYLGDFPLGV